MGAFDLCILKKKYVRILQIIAGFLMFYISGMIIPNPKAILDVDFLI
jgi:hypothetical protein